MARPSHYTYESINHFERGPLFKVTYPSGTVLLIHPVWQKQGANCQVFYLGGSRVESVRQSGMNHLIEHMLFKNKQKSGQTFAQEIEALGGDINAHTSKEYTCFELTCLVKKLPKILPLFFGMAFKGEFDEGELKKEKKVITQEIREEKDNYELLLSEKVMQKGFTHPLGHSILGKITELQKYTAKDVKRFYDTYYSPDRMVVGLTLPLGDEFFKKGSEDSLFHECLKEYAEILNEQQGSVKASTPVRPKLGTGFGRFPSFKLNMREKVENAIVLITYPGPPMKSEWRSSYSLLESYLGEGISSELFQALREEEALVYGLSTQLTCFTDNGMFEIQASCAVKDVNRVCTKVEKIFEKMQNQALSQERLSNLKESYLDNLELLLDDGEFRNLFLSKNELFRGKLVSIKEIRERIEAVTTLDLQRLVKYLQTHGAAYAFLRPV